MDYTHRQDESVTSIDSPRLYAAHRYPAFVAASVSDGGVAYPVVLLRESGSSVFVEVHRNSTYHTSSGGPGFSGMDGLFDASFIVAVGQAFYKSSNAPQKGCLSWFDGWVWHEATVPSTYILCDVYVPEEGVAYVTGYDTSVTGTGKIWRWTPSGGFVEVHSKYGHASWDVTYYHITGSGPDNIWASLVFPGNVVYGFNSAAHFDGATWTDHDIPGRLVSVVSSSLAYGNGITYTNNPLRVFKLEDTTWSTIASMGYSTSNMYGNDATEDYCLPVSFSAGTNRIYKWTEETGLVTKFTWGGRLHRPFIAPDGVSVIALGNNNSGLLTESTDAGENWTPLTYFQQYKYYFASAVLYAEWVPRLRREEILSVTDGGTVDFDSAAPPHFTTATTGTVRGAVLKGFSGSIIEVHSHIDSSSGFASISALNDNYLLAAGRYLGSAEDGRVSYLKGGVWKDIRRARTVTNDESYSSCFALADGDFLFGGTSTGDGHGIWRYNGPPVATKVTTTTDAVVSMGGTSPTNVWALDASGNAYQSTDGSGMSWTSRGSVVAGTGHKISVVDGSTVFAAVSEEVYSWDGGTSWSTVGSPLGMSALALHAVSATEIWVAGYDSVNSLWKIKVWTGASWTEKWSIAAASVTSVHAIYRHPVLSGVVYCVGELSGAPWGVYTITSGSSWSDVTWPSGYGPVTDVFMGSASTPTLRNLVPRPDQGQFYTTADLEVEVVNPSGVEDDSVELDLTVGVSTYPIWSGDSEQTGFNVVKSGVSGGNRYVISLDGRLPAGTEISLGARANMWSPLDTSYSFDSAKTILADAQDYPNGSVSHFNGGEWPYPFYKSSSYGTAYNECFSAPTKNFFAWRSGASVAWYLNGSWHEVPQASLTGCLSITTVWAHSAETHILVGGGIGSSHGRIWKIDAVTEAISIVWSAPWHYLEPRMMRGYGDRVWFCGSAGSGSNDTMYSTNGGDTWLGGGFATGAWGITLSVHVRPDLVVYAGRYRSSSDGKAIVRRDNGSWVELPRIPSGFSFYYAQEVFSASDNDVFAKVQCGLYDYRLYHFNGFEWDWYVGVSSSWRGLNGGSAKDVRMLLNSGSWETTDKGWDGFTTTNRVRTWPTWHSGATRNTDYIDVDLTPPEIVNQAPAQSSTDNPVDSVVSFDLLDPDSGVNLSSVVVTIEGETAWSSDTQGINFTGSRSSVPFGWHYDLDRNYDYNYGTSVTVEVYAEDADGNVLDTDWVWYTPGGSSRTVHDSADAVDGLLAKGPMDFQRRGDEVAVAVVKADIAQPLEAEDGDEAGILDTVEFPSSSVEESYWQTPDIPQGIAPEKQRVNNLDTIEHPASSASTDFWQTPDIPEGIVLPDKPVGIGTPDSVFWTIGSAQYRSDERTTDSEGHPHLITYRPYLLYWGDISNEPWANPTMSNFTGYASDGTHYTDGVQDAGPVYAPWYSEAPSDDRSSVGAFPTKYLIAVSRLELVIYDFSNYPTNLDVWMRFRIGTSTGDTYKLLGRSPETMADAKMLNGVLIVSTLYNGTDYGRLNLIDFRQDDQRFANLIGADEHWMGEAGRDITDRDLAGNWTTSGVSPSLRINPEYVYSMSAYSAADGSKYWVAVAGEDPGPDVIEVDASGVPQLRSTATGEIGGSDLGNVRQVLFDLDGWLWHSYYGKLYRNGLKYQQGDLYIPSVPDPGTPMVDLGTTIWDMVDSENYIYVATDLGVYRIHRGTLDSRLIWTIAGGGGVGKDNVPGSGELLVGTKPEVQQIRAYTLNGSGYLTIATRLDGGNLHGGVTLIRTNDDSVLDSMLYPDLAEDGSYVGVSVGL